MSSHRSKNLAQAKGRNAEQQATNSETASKLIKLSTTKRCTTIIIHPR